ncbi:MAG: hypothetical protein IH594_13935, partial [Bacteroidales bacterium]|nr:hypothetical protein [Bacteroidales bacterium]
DDIILVHAGLNPTLKKPFEDRQFMLNNAGWKVQASEKWLTGNRIIYSHFVQAIDKIAESIYNKDRFICIENGVILREDKPFGHLVGYDFLNDQMYKRYRVEI